MIDVVCHQNTGANFVLLLITRLGENDQLEASVTVYLPDGSVSLGNLDIEPRRGEAHYG